MGLASSRPAVLVAVCVVQCALGLLGAWFAHAGGTPVDVWPATGFAFAALLVYGDRVWLAVLTGSIVVLVAAGEPILVAVAMAAGQTAGVVLAVLVVDGRLGGLAAFERPVTIVQVTALVACLIAPLEATLGTLPATGTAASADVVAWFWLQRWIASLAGMVVVAPVALYLLTSVDLRAWWSTTFRVTVPRRWWAGPLPVAALVTPLPVLWILTAAVVTSRRGLLRFLLTVAAVGATCVVLTGVAGIGGLPYPVEWSVVPVLLWASLVMGRRAMAVSAVLIAVAAAAGTLWGTGPFVRPDGDVAIFLTLVFASGVAAVGFVLAALAADRLRVREQLVTLATSDPLTGLGNHARLLEGLREAAVWAEQSGQSFSVLFLDITGLARINDAEGYQAGNRALCRVAEAVTYGCRDTDVAGRYGGDEFAIVIHGGTEETGREIHRRVAEALARDQDKPPVSVAGAVAVYPTDAESPTLLLRVGDERLAEAKQHPAPLVEEARPQPLTDPVDRPA